MRINFYDQSDEKLGEIKFLGWNKSDDMGFDSEDFTKEQTDFLVAIVNKRNLRSFSLEFATITLTEMEQKEFEKIS
jgi:hypothetical protein